MGVDPLGTGQSMLHRPAVHLAARVGSQVAHVTLAEAAIVLNLNNESAA